MADATFAGAAFTGFTGTAFNGAAGGAFFAFTAEFGFVGAALAIGRALIAGAGALALVAGALADEDFPGEDLPDDCGLADDLATDVYALLFRSLAKVNTAAKGNTTKPMAPKEKTRKYKQIMSLASSGGDRKSIRDHDFIPSPGTPGEG